MMKEGPTNKREIVTCGLFHDVKKRPFPGSNTELLRKYWP